MTAASWAAVVLLSFDLPTMRETVLEGQAVRAVGRRPGPRP